jgi:SAM-dependent methyltransferase
MEFYRNLAQFLINEGLAVPDVESMNSVAEILDGCNSHYLTNGLSSLREIPSDSIDFSYSHSVLEHIRAAEFLPTMQELRRVLRTSGASSHCVDLQDHLGGALNNLRFRDQSWESDFMSGSGFYTNRLRFSEMMRLFQAAGFDPQVVTVNRWSELPTPKAKLAAKFRAMSQDDLLIYGFTVTLKPV